MDTRLYMSHQYTLPLPSSLQTEFRFFSNDYLEQSAIDTFLLQTEVIL